MMLPETTLQHLYELSLAAGGHGPARAFDALSEAVWALLREVGDAAERRGWSLVVRGGRPLLICEDAEMHASYAARVLAFGEAFKGACATLFERYDGHHFANDEHPNAGGSNVITPSGFRGELIGMTTPLADEHGLPEALDELEGLTVERHPRDPSKINVVWLWLAQATAIAGAIVVDRDELPDDGSDFVCGDCLEDVPSMDRCPHCQSVRTVRKDCLPPGSLARAREDFDDDDDVDDDPCKSCPDDCSDCEHAARMAGDDDAAG